MSGTADAVAAFARGDISAEIALMRLLLACGTLPAVLAYLQQVGEPRLLAAARAGRDGLAQAARLVEAGLTAERAGSLAAIREQFDAAVALAPEAAVALYSLGSAETLDRAAAEIADALRRWGLLGARVTVLDIGCGIGRIERALAPEVARITGIDLSPAMIAEARRRCGNLANVGFAVADGGDLAGFLGRRFGLILAVDAFPYLVAAGPAVAARHVADAAGLLEPGGALAIFNYSYRGDPGRDRAELADLAARHGLSIERHGTRDLSLWDGETFLLRQPNG